MSEYLRFVEQSSASGKTKVIEVVATSSDLLLGTIRWFGRWRQYAFYPADETIFNHECLTSINAQIRRLMEERRA